jgi:hypothetical protein
MKKFKRILSVMLSAVMAVSALSFSVAADDDDYTETEGNYYDTYKTHNCGKLTLDELLAMSDEEFAMYDRPIIPVNTDKYIVGGQDRFRCIQTIIRGVGTQIFYYGDELPEDIHDVEHVTDEYLSLIQYPDEDGLDSDAYVYYMYWALRSLVPVFRLSSEDYNAKYLNNVDTPDTTAQSLTHDLNQLLEGQVGFTIKEYETATYIKFDIADMTDLTEENILYYARLYYILSSINPAICYIPYADGLEGKEISETTYAKYLNGDANGDSKLDVFDSVQIAKYTVNGENFDENQLIWADFNKDDSVDVFDAVAVAKKTVE